MARGNRQANGQEKPPQDRLRTWLLFLIVIVGFLAVFLVFWIALSTFRTATDVVAVVGAVGAIIASLVGSFAGVQLSSGALISAQDLVDRSVDKAILFAATSDPDDPIVKAAIESLVTQGRPATTPP